MSITKGTRLGTYEVESPIGAGGMGEVYRARDTRLGRSVAIKVLPRAFADDPERIARFEREGKVLASLNHPHIAALHGMEEFRGEHFLVMELVEGETLADRIFGDARSAPRPLDVDEAIAIARQIAQALEAAHEQGIVHRDLKPANIKLRPDGTVKVLDFGLAKALEPVRADGTSGAGSATITTPAMTQLGVILGTAAYMSPEQAKGRAADKRSDMWAFGCVLFEMLTSRRAFEGEDVSDTLASVLKADPDWTALPANLPQGVRALVHGCLRKDRRERIGDVSTALFLLNQPPAVATDAPPTRARRLAVWQAAALLLGGLAIGVAAATLALRRPAVSARAPVARFAILLPQDQQLTLARRAVAISPDGTQIVYSASGRLFLRSTSELEAHAIPGIERALHPLFSPDGQSLVYWTTDGTIKRIGVGGGTAITICQTSPAPAGISWIGDTILFAQFGIGILRVAANGGRPEVVIPLNSVDGVALDPELLPDGDTVLFTLGRRAGATSDSWDSAKVVAQSLKTGQRTTLIDGGAGARYVPTGHLVYSLAGTLLAVPFDLSKIAVTGGPVPIVEGVRRATPLLAPSPQFAYSTSGSLVYVPGPLSGAGQALMLFDRAGGAEPLKLPGGNYAFPRVSPDGKRLAFEATDGKETTVFVYDLAGTSSPRRLTFGGNNRFPTWSADGRRLVFQSDREGDAALFWQGADGGPAERLTRPDADTSHTPEAWLPAGDVLLFNVAKGQGSSLWMYSVRERKASPLADIRSIGFPTDAAFSPDGRWLAYQVGDGERGEATTFVQPFPPTGTKYQIGIGGRPLWSRTGTELFFVPAPNEFRVVTIATQPAFAFTPPVALPRRFGLADPASPRPYDIAPDGRILGVATAGQQEGGSPAQAQINIVINWFEELKSRVK